ncbi:MAG: DNA translocase FtsK [Clostridia bacterium]|nr:DNA translocase FtsK [Clostridia bacterium]
MPKSTQTKKRSSSAKGGSKKNTRASSAKGKAPVQETRRNGQYQTVVRYVLGFFALFLIITFFPGVDSGLLGGVREIFKGLFGFGYYLAPFCMLIGVFRWDSKQETGVNAAKAVLLFADFMFFLCLVHLVAAKTTQPVAFGDAVKSLDGLYLSGREMTSAGAVGGFFCAMVARVIGWVSTAILASLGMFVTTVLLCGSTPMATVKRIYRFFRDLSLSDEEEEEEDLPMEAPAPAPKKKTPAIPKEPAVQKEEKAEKKHKVPTVLVDDRSITDTPTENENIVREKNGQHRFILPEEEQEEVFSRVPIELFRKDSGEKTVAAPPLSKTPEAEKPAEPVKTNEKHKYIEEEEEVFVRPAAPVEETPAPAPVSEPAEEEPAEEVTELEMKENVPPPYVFPPISLLTPGEGDAPKPTAADVSAVSRKLESVLESFKVKAHVIGASFGPTVTQYEVQPETGVRVKQIANLSDDIALHLAAPSVRIENIPGKSAIGIEIPNRSSSVVRLRRLIENSTFRDHKSKLVTALGEDVSGNPVYLDIAKMPHLMIAGATGMGKSVCMNSLIVSLLYHASPDEVKFIMIDPKKVEMADYNGIPHLLVPVINDAKKAAGTLNWACVEMEKRYNLIQEVAAKNLVEYNMIVKDDPEREQQPYIVIFIDELADLMMTAPDDVETSICRLAQKARAAGIHLVIGTQRPSVDVITGLIKANIPSRIAFTVASQVDSRTILDLTGAEKLLGRGDMLYYPVGAMKPIRVQGALVDGKSEVVAITQFIKDAATASYDEDIISQIEKEAKLCGAPKNRRAEAEGEGGDEPKLDEKFLDALEMAIDTQNISTSMVQTRLGLGYARAARIVGVMEQKGYIGSYDTATKARKILVTREELMEMRMNKADEENEG